MALTPSLEHLSFQALFNALADAMLLVDNAGYILLANSAAHALLGYTSGAICGLPLKTLIPKLDLEQRNRQHDVSSSFINKNNKLIALTQDGRELRVSVNLISPQALGQSTVVIALYDDRRRQAEESLRISEERLHLAKRAAGLGVYDRDLTNNTLYWDERSRELWGLEPDEEITYEKFESYIHPDDRAGRYAALCRALDPASNGEYQTEFRITRKNDGAECWIATVGQISFEDNEPVRLLGLMRDITEHKAMENQNHERRNETEALVKRQIAVQTASAIAHEINQPLTAISAYSEVALHSLKNNNMSSENLCRALEGCVAQAQRAGDTLHELLNFLRQSELVVEPTNINRLVKAAIDIAKKDGYGGFHPLLKLEQDMPPVLCNPLQVQKVILNLVRNAIEAIHGSGVTAANITIKVRKMAKKNMALVTVQDSGPGFDNETAKRIFEPFFTTKSKGIGMGLAISRSLIEANGGKLWHDPDTKAGATIHFTLPFSP